MLYSRSGPSIRASCRSAAARGHEVEVREMYAFASAWRTSTLRPARVHQPEGLAQGINPFTHGSAIHTDVMKTQRSGRRSTSTASTRVRRRAPRRGEEPRQGAHLLVPLGAAPLDPKNQRPSSGASTTRAAQGRVDRVFPMSNWTSSTLQYIYLRAIPIVPLYFRGRAAGGRARRHADHVDDERMPLYPGERPMMKKVRFRPSAATRSPAPSRVRQTRSRDHPEMLLTTSSERQGRVIDHDQSASMEKKKQEGYF